MHILLLTAYFPPDVGSAAHLFYELGQTLVKRGHRVSVVTGLPGYHAQGNVERYRRKLYLCESVAGMTVFRIAVAQIARDTAIGRGIWQFSCASNLALAGLRADHPDVILVYSPPLPLGLTALLWRGLHGSPFVLNVQDLFPQSAIDLGILRHKLLVRFYQALEHLVYQHADAITVHSPGNRTHVLAQGARAESTFVVPNSVDTDYLRPGPRDNALRQALGLDGHFVATFAGIMGYSQDIDVILAAADLLRDVKGICFLLVGDGVDKPRLTKKGRDMQLPNVMWLPMQSREDYPALLQASDVGLATLRADVRTPVVPSKIHSIMAAGRPVVAATTPQGDVPALLSEAQAGVWLKPGDARALADALLTLWRDPGRVQQMGQNGRRYAETYLAVDRIAERYEEIFAMVVRRTRRL